jgi:hypothetical protein
MLKDVAAIDNFDRGIFTNQDSRSINLDMVTSCCNGGANGGGGDFHETKKKKGKSSPFTSFTDVREWVCVQCALMEEWKWSCAHLHNQSCC